MSQSLGQTLGQTQPVFGRSAWCGPLELLAWIGMLVVLDWIMLSTCCPVPLQTPVKKD
ncbi:MAG TPA: hypothetical protein VGY55_07500 [Pirellulales bacterium]|nr:hypothetical protein [Pirellulales bacterium]